MWSWLAIGLSGLYSVLGTKQANFRQAQIFKLLTLALLLVLILTAGNSADHTDWIAGGLVTFMLADMLHSLKSGRFLKALYFTGYLLAQVCYSKAFWVQLNGEVIWWLLALLLSASIVAFFLLLPRLDALLLPVAIMGVMLVQMAWVAGEVWLQMPSYSSALGFGGTLVMIASALGYALYDCRKMNKTISLWVNGSYLLCHALIVASGVSSSI
ncbi:lysoplasmalogenase family protein [Vibrio sagamiensis]|uniref:Membrane protein n=1 Tax=Vibrio sagamiensis NBRC 104589 TaxID=1219064 RepID=A0A511QHT9_9VIBR|nr:lysoplasmalogenase family protein [Vibrio sagamiensis]PNQ58649.1 lysoplasmalogenase [Vibrio agarivorans]GEM76879.1 membrane protein [Vibrio sagamiensis NBRC 104589]